MAWPSIAAPDTINGVPVMAQEETTFETGRTASRVLHTSSREKVTLGWRMMTRADFLLLKAARDVDLGGSFPWTDPEYPADVYTMKYIGNGIKGYRRSGQWPGYYLDVTVEIGEV